MKRWLLRLLLLFTPLALAFAAAEVALRRQVPFCGVTPFQNSGIEGLSHVLRPSFRTLYKGVEVRSNATGFRGAEWPAPAKGRKRVAFVGDSVTYGSAIPEEDTFVALLNAECARRGLPFDALNCGAPGYDCDNVRLVLEHLVLPRAPDAVVYVFVFNDVEKNKLSGDIPPDKVIDTLSEYPLRSAALQWLGLRGSALLRAVKSADAGGWVQQNLAAFEQGGRERLRAALARMQALCAARGVPLLVVSYPQLFRRDVNPFAPIDRAAGEECAKLGIPFQDLAEVFGEREELGPFWASAFDSHPNGAANARVAEQLADLLEARLGSGK